MTATQGPNPDAAVEQYRRASLGYDRHMRRFARWRQMAVERLRLAPGEAVIDVACGTGLNFPALQAYVGESGRIIGIDLSPEMLAKAQARVSDEGWENVSLIEAPVEEAPLGSLRADGALFSFTHDVLQSPAAVANVVRHLRSGARVASVGAKLAASWNLPVNFFVRRAARPYLTTFAGLERPWKELEKYTGGSMSSKSLALGGAHLAWGQITQAGLVLAGEEVQGHSP